jgi:hypothetical protein
VADGRCRHAPFVLAIAAFALALGGCDKLTFKTFALPGFSVDAPDFVKIGKGASYRAGGAEGQLGTKTVSISWEVGGIMSTDEMPKALGLAIEHLAKGQHFELGDARTVTIGGQTATQIEGKSGPHQRHAVRGLRRDQRPGHRSEADARDAAVVLRARRRELRRDAGRG